MGQTNFRSNYYKTIKGRMMFMLITDVLNEIAGKFCDEYCKFNEEYKEKYGDTDDYMEKLCNEKCETCPVMKI